MAGPAPGEGNVLHSFTLLHGRGEAGFDEAEVVVEGEWECAGAAHAPLEPHAALAEWSDGRLTVWTGTQTPFNVRRELAAAFALDESRVRVVSPPMGGSFGAKTFTRVEAIAAALARKAGPSGAHRAAARRGLRDARAPPGALPRAARRAS